MQKDPAVLWYYRDYLQGTEELSWSEQGAYSRLLNKQADKGHLTLATIKKTLKKDFKKLWPGIIEKFLTDSDGNYYNERMDIEVEKRRKHSQHQKDKADERWKKQRDSHGNAPAYTTALPLANANADADEKNKNGADFSPHPIGIEKVARVAGEVWKNQRWVENICMGHQLTPEGIRKWMAQFNSSICNDVMEDFDQGKYQKLFGGWLNRQKGKGYSLNQPLTGSSSAPPLKPIN